MTCSEMLLNIAARHHALQMFLDLGCARNAVPGRLESWTKPACWQKKAAEELRCCISWLACQTCLSRICLCRRTWWYLSMHTHIHAGVFVAVSSTEDAWNNRRAMLPGAGHTCRYKARDQEEPHLATDVRQDAKNVTGCIAQRL